jgi:hypothetical protein
LAPAASASGPVVDHELPAKLSPAARGKYMHRNINVKYYFALQQNDPEWAV